MGLYHAHLLGECRGFERQFFLLAQQVIYPLGHLPRPFSHFYCVNKATVQTTALHDIFMHVIVTFVFPLCYLLTHTHPLIFYLGSSSWCFFLLIYKSSLHSLGSSTFTCGTRCKSFPHLLRLAHMFLVALCPRLGMAPPHSQQCSALVSAEVEEGCGP